MCDTPANAEGIPEGSYSGSCGGCTLTGDSLACSHCMGTDGLHHESTILVSSCVEPQVVGNSDGSLACEDPAPPAAEPLGDGAAGRRLEDLDPHAEDVPEGTYKESCGGCKVDEQGMLNCECMNGFGALVESSVLVAALGEDGKCTAENLENIDGTVTCKTAAAGGGEEAPKEDL